MGKEVGSGVCRWGVGRGSGVGVSNVERVISEPGIHNDMCLIPAIIVCSSS